MYPKLVHTKILERDQAVHHQDAPAFDHTKLDAINTCPKWGLVRYEKHLAPPGQSRKLALEAGAACHEFFAAVRLYQLRFVQGLPDHFEVHGVRIFGANQFKEMKQHLHDHEFNETEALNFCLEALYQSGYHDDPCDKKRTMTNLETACMVYFRRWWKMQNQTIYVENADDPNSFVGIEIPFELPIVFTDDANETHLVRFTGKIDGVHRNRDEDIILHENKTTSVNITDSWINCWETSHQVSGYTAAGNAILGQDVSGAKVLGLNLLYPESAKGITFVDTGRLPHQMEMWAEWFFHTYMIWKNYKDDPVEAPMYAQSCNRYFSTCPMFYFCLEDKEAQRDQLETEFVKDEWSPLHA